MPHSCLMASLMSWVRAGLVGEGSAARCHASWVQQRAPASAVVARVLCCGLCDENIKALEAKS
jgi:hypothetical protein